MSQLKQQLATSLLRYGFWLCFDWACYYEYDYL